MTPGWLSRHILWEKRSLRAAAAAASTMCPDVRFRLTEARLTGGVFLSFVVPP